jgi:hypothetical protein
MFALLGLAAALVGCRPEEADILLPEIKIAGPALTFDAETKLASCPLDMQLVNIPLTITANRDWNAEINWDSDEIPWIAVTPEAGVASDQPQQVTLTVLNNAGYNRNKRVKFTIGYDYKTIDITQTGERGEEIIGTLDNPLTVAGAVKYVKSLGADVQSSSGVYVKGKISRIDDGNNFAASGTYGNATFYISDDGGTTSEQFYCYRVLYLGNKKWTSKDPDVKVGDDVIIYGHVVNYKGNTPETVQGTAFVYEHNGVNRGIDEGGGGGSEGTPAGSGTAADPYNVAAARAAVKDLTWTSNTEYEKTGTVYVKGKISRIADNGTFGQSGTFGNATFYINDDGADGAELYAYRILYLGNKKYTSGTDIKVGDEVVICGELMNYRGNTPETVSNAAYLYSLNGEGGGGGDTPPGPGGNPAGTGTQTDPYNVAAARNAVKDFTWTSNTEYDKTGTVYVKGKISKIADNGTFGQSGTFGNATFYISDDGKEGNELYCYRILYLGNVKYTSGTDIKVGDEVVICGELMNYRGNTPETVANAAYLYSLNESGGGGGGGDTPGGASGTGTLADPYNPLGAINAVKDLTWTSNTDYQSTGEVYVKGKISRIASGGTFTEGGTYGNASFYISEDGKAENEFYCFRILYLGNKKFEAGQTDIKVGDEVVVYGKLMNYRGNTPETVSGSAYLYSLNDSGSGGGGGDTPGGGNGSGTLADPYDPLGAINAVKDLTWTSNTVYDKTDKVYVKGKISRIASGGTYTEGGTYGNASYWISADGTENDEFQIFRSLYFNGEKYTSGTDIKVGDEVIVYGALMNYRCNTPETVANENWLYSLNGKTDGSGGGGGGDTPAAGTLENPYTVAQALDAVKDFTWTSNTEFDSTDDVYMKGKISRIASGGTFTEGGTYGNASFYISDDGTETNEFYCFRVLYLGNKKFEAGQTDIKVGDEVIICGKLMNYKGNTPETVSGKAYLYSLNDGGTPGGGGGDTPSGSSVSFATNAETQTWAAETDGTYGVGFGTTTEGLKLGYYKHTGGTAAVAPNANHVRIYKNSVLSVASAEGKKIKKIVIGCAPNSGTTSYCFDMAGLEGGASATCDKSALTVTWTGSASKVVLHANNGQIRMEKITVEFE